MMKSLLVLSLLLSALWGMGIDIVRDGKAVAPVYIEAAAPVADRNAAAELVAYVKRMTGVELPVVHELPTAGNRILIGSSKPVQEIAGIGDFAKLRADEILLLSPDSRTLIIAGEGHRGALYAVYSLLEICGVRFWSPTLEFVPSVKELSVKEMNHRYAPPFALRESFSETAKQGRSWCAKVKLNGDMWLPEIPEASGGSRKMDMRQSLANDYLKAKDFFATHPEWYAWREKENARSPKQICMTNHQALEQLVKEVKRDLAAEPDREFISVALPDNDIGCECANCKKIQQEQKSFSALSIYCANFVAKAIAKEFPLVKVVILAYWPTERPPVNMAMEKNCAVVFAMLDRNHGLPPAATARHNPYLEQWRKASHGNVYIWDYYATFGNFMLPMPNLYVMQDAVRTYRDFQVQGVLAQLPWGSLAEFEELRTWLLAQLLWNPDLDGKKLIAEYLDGCYGKAAPFVQQYIDLLEHAKLRQKNTWIGVYSEKTDHWLRPGDILAARKLFADAAAAAADNPGQVRRVRQLFASVQLVSILRYQDIAKEARKDRVSLPAYFELVDDLKKMGDEFRCDTYKEWDSFSNLIKRLQSVKPDSAAVLTPGTVETRLTGDALTGNQAQSMTENGNSFLRLNLNSEELAFPWMNLAAGSVFGEISENLAGIWQVWVTLRVAVTGEAVPDGAYLGIYAPEEIFRCSFPSGSTKSDWQTVSLGEWNLPPKSRIWIMPGVFARNVQIDVKEIRLAPPAKN